VGQIVLLGLVLILNAWVTHILADAAEAYNVYDLGALIGALRGLKNAKMWEAVCNGSIWLTMYVTLSGYVIIIADTISELTGLDLKNEFMSRCLVLTIASLCILPLCFLDGKRLSMFSSMAILVNVYLFFLILSAAPSGAATTDACFLGWGIGSVAYFSTLECCVVIQMCLLPMFECMENRSAKTFKSTVDRSFMLVFVLFSAFVTAADFAFGAVNMQDNVMNNLPHGVLSNIAQFGMLVCISAVYPLMVAPMVLPIKNMVENKEFWGAVTSVFIVGVVLLTGILFTGLGKVNVYNGVVSVVACGTVAPAAVGLYSLSGQGFWHKSRMYGLIIFGVVVGILGAVYTDNYVSEMVCWVPLGQGTPGVAVSSGIWGTLG
jgi:hypothetical protein